jgi:hypothetical protein
LGRPCALMCSRMVVHVSILTDATYAMDDWIYAAALIRCDYIQEPQWQLTHCLSALITFSAAISSECSKVREPSASTASNHSSMIWSIAGWTGGNGGTRPWATYQSLAWTLTSFCSAAACVGHRDIV